MATSSDVDDTRFVSSLSGVCCSAGRQSQGGYDPTMAAVLVVDDESIVRDVVVRYLERDGYVTHEAADGAHARTIIETTPLDLIVLDVMLPEIGGMDLCRWVRHTSSTPIIMLTARAEEADRIVGLELGADDYVTKPFSPRELVARVGAVLRRTAASGDVGSESVLVQPTSGQLSGRSSVGSAGSAASAVDPLPRRALNIDPVARRVDRRGKPVELTAKEFDLLAFLAANPGQVFSRGQLMQQVWGIDAEVDIGDSTVTVHMRRLRTKIEDDPSSPVHIQTVRGVGYRFEP